MTYTQASDTVADTLTHPDAYSGALPEARARGVARMQSEPGAAAGGDRDNAALSPDAWIRAQRVTVLMATFNRAHYIEEALDSLLQQTRPPDELIVIDDGSTDDTSARLRRYGARIKYFYKENGGMASAMNRGLSEATGDWIWCFGDDDAALPDALERLLHGLAVQRDADFVYGGLRTGRSGEDGRIVAGHVVLPPAVASADLFFNALRNIPFLMPAALIRRERFVSLNGFDESYARSQDYDFLLRLLVDARGVRVPEPIFVWRSHDGPRGPAHLRHDGALRERVWMEVGGRLGRELRRRLPLAAYIQRADGPHALGMRDLRAALLGRMVVMASKGLMREMLVDLHSAANLRPENQPAGLTSEERWACREVARFPFFQMRLLDAPDRTVTRLLAAAGSRAGKAMLAPIARGILHAARRSDRAAAERRVLFRCALRLFLACGPVASVTAYLPARPR